tara:strand:+ start:154 stop:384 length:231 start_codon:yes stop_codon:yes gene_type:complete
MMSVDGKNIKRVTDEDASELYQEGWTYVSKSLWKEKVRDVEKESTLNKETGKLELTNKKSNKMSKAQKRHMRKANK